MRCLVRISGVLEEPLLCLKPLMLGGVVVRPQAMALSWKRGKGFCMTLRIVDTWQHFDFAKVKNSLSFSHFNRHNGRIIFTRCM